MMMNSQNNTTYGDIINIQHFSVDDGPGIRTTVFLKGCPLSCLWCHNPESQNRSQELLYRKDKCIGCGECVKVCPADVHSFENNVHKLSRGLCRLCSSCVDACCFEALEMAGRTVSADEVLSEVLLDKVFYDRSGGGVTISGGEPLYQPDFTVALLRLCKQEGLHTCVETCGFGSTEKLSEISRYTDLFLFDYKLTDEEMHKKYTGVSNAPILKNLDMLNKSGAGIILRCPMIPDVNLDETHYDGIAHIAEKYENIREIHLEPYHPLGINKALALGREVTYNKSEFLDKENLVTVKDYIQSKVSIKVNIA